MRVPAGFRSDRLAPFYDWRPFAGSLSAGSVRQALVILNACFAWLTEAGYLAGNPLALARRRRAPSRPRITRYLSHDWWATVKDTVAAMPTATERERLHAARCRWVLTVLYLGGLRASELTATTMGAFFCRRDAQGTERWWLEVTGKGNKVRLVPATDELIAELARYRRANGLPATPQPGETRPLVLPVIGREMGRDKALSRGALHLILKEVFGMAAARLRARGPEWEAQAAVLASASAHWLRHTAGSHMTDQQVDLRFVRDNFGHVSIATTSGYLHIAEGSGRPERGRFARRMQNGRSNCKRGVRRWHHPNRRRHRTPLMRLDCWCSMRATKLLPVPVYPYNNTVRAWLAATRAIRSRRAAIDGWSPTSCKGAFIATQPSSRPHKKSPAHRSQGIVDLPDLRVLPSGRG